MDTKTQVKPVETPPAAKAKKPIYKRWWAIALAAIFVIGGISQMGGGDDAKPVADTPAAISDFLLDDPDIVALMKDPAIRHEVELDFIESIIVSDDLDWCRKIYGAALVDFVLASKARFFAERDEQ